MGGKPVTCALCRQTRSGIQVLGRLRVHLAEKLGIIDQDVWHFAGYRFSLCSLERRKSLGSSHHLFTSPMMRIYRYWMLIREKLADNNTTWC
jgi:aspartyl-tRNA synthetase